MKVPVAALIAAMLAAGPAHAQAQMFVKQMTVNSDAPRAPYPADARAFQDQLIGAVMNAANGKRAEAGLPPVAWDPVLAEAADRYSRKMRDFQFFKHTTPAGQTLATRLPQQVLQRYAKLGENLWSAQGAVDWRAGWLAEQAAANWVESRTHRTNLLEPAFTQAGVGVAFSAERGVYLTMMFGRPQGAVQAVARQPQAPPPPDLYGFAQALPGEIVSAVNAERTRRGLPPLRTDPALSRTALRHSEGLLDGGAFSEMDAGGVSVLNRAIQSEPGRARSMAVGLWHGSGNLVFEPRALAASVMQTWRGKAGNMNDLLDPRFDIAGIGVATNGNRVVVTALYAETADPVTLGAPAPQPGQRVITVQ